MQTAARDALDIAGETAATRRLYGIDDAATERLASAQRVAVGDV